MRTRNGLILAVAIAAGLPVTAVANDRATLSVGGGASGTSNSAFRGGWGAVISLEVPMNSSAAFLLRADYHAVPEEGGGGAWFATPEQTGSVSLFGPWPDGARRVSAAALLAGFRIQAQRQRVQTYLDAMVGVGHMRHDSRRQIDPRAFPVVVRPEIHDDTNVALGFGAGIKLRGLGEGSLFLDAHYDFYFVSGGKGAIIPVRLGYGIPVGKRSI